MWRRALFVLLAAVLALGTLPSQALAEMAEEAMGEEPASAQATGRGEARDGVPRRATPASLRW